MRYAPGPYGQPGDSTEFLGRRSSYIRFPNNGRLDAKNSITLLAWVLPMGRGPIFEYWHGVKFWLVRSDTLYAQFIRRNRRRTRVLIKRRLRPHRWNYVGATYDQRTGMATLWLDSRPIASENIKRISLATKGTAYMGSNFRGRIACMQVYSVAMTGPQIKKVKNLCNKPGKCNKSEWQRKWHCISKLNADHLLMTELTIYHFPLNQDSIIFSDHHRKMYMYLIIVIVILSKFHSLLISVFVSHPTILRKELHNVIILVCFLFSRAVYTHQTEPK